MYDTLKTFYMEFLSSFLLFFHFISPSSHPSYSSSLLRLPCPTSPKVALVVLMLVLPTILIPTSFFLSVSLSLSLLLVSLPLSLPLSFFLCICCDIGVSSYIGCLE